MNRLFQTVYLYLATRRVMLLAAVFLTLVFGAIGSLRLSLDDNISAMLPSGEETIDDYRTIITSFQYQNRMFFEIGLKDGAGGSQDDVLEVADHLYDELVSSEFFEHIYYRVSEQDAVAALEWLDEHKAALFDPTAEAALRGMTEPDRIEERLLASYRLLLESPGGTAKRLVRRDPLNFREIFVAKLGATRAEWGGANIIQGRMWSGDERYLMIVAAPRFPSTDARKSERLVRFLERAVDEAVELVPGSGVAVHYTGGHRIAIDNQRMIKQDVLRTMTATVLAIVLLTFLTYRRKHLVLLSFAPVAFGAIAAMAVYSLFSDNVQAIVVGCGAVLIGIAIDFSIHVLHRFDNFDDFGCGFEALGRRLGAVATPVSIGAVTTMAAFLSLNVSLLPGQRQLGLFAAIGIAAAATFALVVLPQLLPSRPPRSKQAILPLSRFYEGFSRWHERHELLVVLVIVALSGVALVGLGRVRLDGDFLALSGMPDGTRRDHEAILDRWGGALSNRTTLVASGASLEEALQKNDIIFKMLQQFEESESVAEVTSIAPILPSLETQHENVRRWQTMFDEGARRQLEERLAAAAGRLGFSPTAFAPFRLELRATEQRLVSLQQLEDGPIGAALEGYVGREEGAHLVLTTMFVSPERYEDVDLAKGLRGRGRWRTADHARSLRRWRVRSSDGVAFRALGHRHRTQQGVASAELLEPGGVPSDVVGSGVSVHHGRGRVGTRLERCVYL